MPDVSRCVELQVVAVRKPLVVAAFPCGRKPATGGHPRKHNDGLYVNLKHYEASREFADNKTIGTAMSRVRCGRAIRA